MTLTNSGGLSGKEPLPLRKIVRRALQREGAKRHDQPGLFRMGDEIGRRDQPFFRMVPAQQRLEPGHGPVGEPHDRLVEHLELVVLKRCAQIGFQRDGIAWCGEAHRLRVDACASAAVALGLRQRQFRVFDQVLRVARIAGPP